MTDGTGRDTLIGYDAFRRVDTIRRPNPNGAGNMFVTAIDSIQSAAAADNNPDADSRRQATIKQYVENVPGELVTTVEMDRFGNVTRQIDGAGRETKYGRNIDGFTTQIELPDRDAGDSILRPTIVLTLDASGNVTRERQVVGLVDSPGNGETNDIVTDTEFDSLNNPTRILLPDPDGPSLPGLSSDIRLGWTGRDLTSIRRVVGAVDTTPVDDILTTLVYGAVPGVNAGQVTKLTTQDPDWGATDYKALETESIYASVGTEKGLVTEIKVKEVGGGTLDHKALKYDSARNLKSVHRVIGAVDPSMGESNDLLLVEYVHDALDRPIEIKPPDPDDAGPLYRPRYVTTFDAAGRVQRENDRTDGTKSIATRYKYGGTDLVTQITTADPDGSGPGLAGVEKILYDNFGFVDSTTDARGGTTDFTVNGVGQVSQMLLPDPVTGAASAALAWNFDFDGLGNQTKALGPDPDGAGFGLPRPETLSTFDDWLGLVQVKHPDPDGDTVGTPNDRPIETFARDRLGRTTLYTAPNGGTTAWVFDVLGRNTSITLPDADGAGSEYTSAVWTHAFDGLDRMKSRTGPDPDGAGPLGQPVSEWKFDPMGATKQFILPDPDAAGSGLPAPDYEFQYDATTHLLVTSIDPSNRESDLAYDKMFRNTTTTLPDPDGVFVGLPRPVWTNGFDNFGNTSRVTAPDPDGSGPLVSPYTDYENDSLGRTTKVIGPDIDGSPGTPNDRPTSTFKFDAANQLIETFGPMGEETDYSWDKLGRNTQVEGPDPDGAQNPLLRPITTMAYDGLSRIVRLTGPDPDADGTGKPRPETDYIHDLLGRTTSIVGPDLDGNAGTTGDRPTTSFLFDVSSNLTRITDPKGFQTNFTPDLLNRIKSESNQFGTRLTTFDALSNVASTTDRLGRKIEYQRDGLSRPKEERWKDGATTVRTIYSTFNIDGDLVSVLDADSSYTYAFDAAHRPTLVTAHGGLGRPQVKFTNTWDNLDRRTNLKAEVGTTLDFQNDYFYDGLSRTTKIEQTNQSGGNTVAPKRVDFGWDLGSRLTSLSRYKDLAGGTSNLVAASTYGWDNLNRMTSLTHLKNATTFADYDFSYDGLSPITSSVQTSSIGGSIDGTATYGYDQSSQITTADYTSAQPDESFGYDIGGNRNTGGFTPGTGNLVTTDGTYNYLYDAEGNRIRRTLISTGGITEYEWDHRNRLTRVAERTTLGGAATKSTVFKYDVYNRRIVKSHDADGDGAGAAVIQGYAYDSEDVVFDFNNAGAIKHRYLHGPGIDNPLAQEDPLQSVGTADRVIWMLEDNLGTLRDLVDNAGNLDNHIRYDSFGGVYSESNPAVDSIYGFTGRERDEETGLTFYRARYYDPKTNGFIGKDPIGFAAGDYNLSRYVGNSPTNLTDPSRLTPLSATLRGTIMEVLDERGKMFEAAETLGSLVDGDASAEMIQEQFNLVAHHYARYTAALDSAQSISKRIHDQWWLDWGDVPELDAFGRLAPRIDGIQYTPQELADLAAGVREDGVAARDQIARADNTIAVMETTELACDVISLAAGPVMAVKQAGKLGLKEGAKYLGKYAAKQVAAEAGARVVGGALVRASDNMGISEQNRRTGLLAFSLIRANRLLLARPSLGVNGGTYVLRDPETGSVMRSGRSKDLHRREGEHARDPLTKDLEFEVDRYSDEYNVQRGAEQLLHDRYNPPMDKINPISPRNPRRQDYLDAAEGR